MNVDFELQDLAAAAEFSPSNAGLWDFGIWDESSWGSELLFLIIGKASQVLDIADQRSLSLRHKG
jgi:hypothetical protein